MRLTPGSQMQMARLITHLPLLQIGAASQATVNKEHT